MKNIELNEKELMEVNGGFEVSGDSNGQVALKCVLVFSGEAARHTGEYGTITVKVTDSEGTATGYVSAATGWQTTFYVKAGDTFYFDLDLRQYWPNITGCDNGSFNQATNVFTYQIW